MAERKKCARCGKRWRTSGAYCKPCHRAKRLERLQKDPNAGARAQAKYQKTGRGREARQRYEDSEKGLETRRQEVESGRKAAYERRYRMSKSQQAKRETDELTAYLPVEVVQPFVVQMLGQFRQPPSSPVLRKDTDPWEGISALAENVHVGPKKLKDILEEKDPRVDYLIVDRLATYGMFSLDEIYDRAREWALLTESNWPDGYFRWEGDQFQGLVGAKPREKPKPKPKRSSGLVYAPAKEVIRVFMEYQPLTRHDLAEKTGKPYRTAADRVAWMHKRGLLRTVGQRPGSGNGRQAEFVLSALGQKIADTLASEISTQ